MKSKSEKRPERGRALFYSRDSGGKHEQTPSQYVEWACRRANELGLAFHGTPEAIRAMILQGEPVSGDLYFDDDVKGNLMSRPALDSLREEIDRDPSISHVRIPKRNRLARPDNASDGVALEIAIRVAGVRLVFIDKMLDPIRPGHRQDFVEALTAMIDYHQSGEFRTELAEKMVFAQLQLARQGFSTGGRAPFGFRRALVSGDGKFVRDLADGEKVRLAGHHVVWLPGGADKLELIRRILTMLKTVPATRIARRLTAEGIPSPDAGRTRKDNGVKHAVSGVWHATTITNIARNPLIRAMTSYGRRSMGDQRRVTPTGPRELDDGDYSSGKPKVIRNPESVITTAAAKFEPVVPIEEIDQLCLILDKRGRTQRGKPRSRQPDNNPLGGRVYDLACTWPMYRRPYNDSFHYTCGLYQQSHSAKCRHNHIDGKLASKFVLAAIRQRLLAPEMLARLEKKLRERAKVYGAGTGHAESIARAEAALVAARAELDTARRNLARAKTDDQYAAVSQEFEKLVVREKQVVTEVTSLKGAVNERPRVNAVRAALEILGNLTELADDAENLGALGKLFVLLNAQMFLRFHPVKKLKRVEQKLSGGVLTFGDAPPPITKYEGPTSRRVLQLDGGSSTIPVASRASGSNEISTDEEEKSYGNVSRGDRI